MMQMKVCRLKCTLSIMVTLGMVWLPLTGCSTRTHSAWVPEPALTEEAVRLGTVARVQAATVVLATDQHVFPFKGEFSRTFTQCSGTVCAVSPTAADLQAALIHARTEHQDDYGLRHFAQHLKDTLSFKPLDGTTRGVPIVQGFGLHAGERGFNVRFFAGWLDDGAFFVNRTVRHVGGLPGGPATVFDASAVGVANLMAPTVAPRMSGTWKGAMVGADVGDTVTRGQFVRGDAMLVIEDFTDPHVDVAFGNLHDLETGARLQDRRIPPWEDIPVRGGTFGTRRTGNADYIQGRFLGENHRGVAGIFERGELVGSFGANRQPED